MSKFRKDGKKTTPMASTSSTSDIVFMFLFFFMVTTNLRKTENKVIVKLPEASEVVKLERKDLASYINIGTPVKHLQSQFGTDSRIQLNDSFKTADDIRQTDNRELGECEVTTSIARVLIGKERIRGSHMGKSHSIPDKEKNILRNALRALLLQRQLPRQ